MDGAENHYSAYLLVTFDCDALRFKVLGRILKVGVQIFKQGVQGSNVHDLFNPTGPRRSPFFPRKTPTAVQFHAVDVVMLTIHLNASLLEY